MKKYLFLLLILGSLTAMGQEERPRYVQPQRFGEERPMFIQYLDLVGVKTLDIHMTGNYTTLCIYQDTVDYVGVRLNSWDDTNRIPDNIFTLNPTAGLHILSVYGFGTAGELEVHTSIKNLSILNEWYNLIVVSSSTDTLRFNSIGATAQGNSTIQFLSPMVVENGVWLMAEDQGYIKYYNYECVDYSEMTRDQGSIVGRYRNGEEVSKPLAYNTVGQRLLPGRMGWYNLSDRIHLNLYAALNGCRTEEKSYHPAAAIKNSIGSFQGELTYDIVARKQFTFGVGIGYSRDKYRFKDHYVHFVGNVTEYDENGFWSSTWPYNNPIGDNPPSCGNPNNWYEMPSNPGIDSLQYWSSSMKVSYFTIPIHFEYYVNKDHSQGLHVGFDLVPGFALGDAVLNQHFGRSVGKGVDEYTNVKYESLFNMNSYDRWGIDPMCDIRLSAGWGVWNVFAQYALERFWFCSAYFPFKVGIKLSL